MRGAKRGRRQRGVLRMSLHVIIMAPMVRTQIQVTNDQHRRLQELARERGVSMAKLVRMGVDRLQREEGGVTRAARVRRAKEACGRFSSGHADGSQAHDRELAEAFRTS